MEAYELAEAQLRLSCLQFAADVVRRENARRDLARLPDWEPGGPALIRMAAAFATFVLAGRTPADQPDEGSV